MLTPNRVLSYFGKYWGVTSENQSIANRSAFSPSSGGLDLADDKLNPAARKMLGRSVTKNHQADTIS